MCVGKLKLGPIETNLPDGAVGIALQCPLGALLLTCDASPGSGHLLLSLPSNQKEWDGLRFSFFRFWVYWLSSVLDRVDLLCSQTPSIWSLSKVNLMSKEHLTDTELICCMTLLSCVGAKGTMNKAQFEPWVHGPNKLAIKLHCASCSGADKGCVTIPILVLARGLLWSYLSPHFILLCFGLQPSTAWERMTCSVSRGQAFSACVKHTAAAHRHVVFQGLPWADLKATHTQGRWWSSAPPSFHRSNSIGCCNYWCRHSKYKLFFLWYF